jgi:hypothetical protein
VRPNRLDPVLEQGGPVAASHWQRAPPFWLGSSSSAASREQALRPELAFPPQRREQPDAVPRCIHPECQRDAQRVSVRDRRCARRRRNRRRIGACTPRKASRLSTLPGTSDDRLPNRPSTPLGVNGSGFDWKRASNGIRRPQRPPFLRMICTPGLGGPLAPGIFAIRAFISLMRGLSGCTRNASSMSFLARSMWLPVST